ncbi:interleukin-6 [Malaclemys terrapin pileata]|uniref:interleukin-6 n=1 Tax=Malaclemys terrapin pileata TaxID=2991368 RepID=UPI0023A80EFE|nr:interleukin-6 [Malaclemys terrapin pileata]
MRTASVCNLTGRISLRSLVYFLFSGFLLAATLLLGTRAVPLPDSSGEEELVDPSDLLARSPSLPDCESLAWLLHSQAVKLKDEMCEKFTVCDNSMEMLAQNNLNLPKITEEDGCLLSGFNEEKCLSGISSGLFTFQTYLEYVQETFISEKQKVESICYGTKHLANTVRQMVKNPDAVIMPDPATQSTLFAKLKSNKKWIEKISTHLILRDFTSFMEKTVRAVRYLKNSRNLSV